MQLNQKSQWFLVFTEAMILQTVCIDSYKHYIHTCVHKWKYKSAWGSDRHGSRTGSKHVAFVKSTGVSTETGAAGVRSSFPKEKACCRGLGSTPEAEVVQLWEGDSPFQVTGLWTTGCRAKMQPFPEKAPGGLDGAWWWEPEGRGPGASTPTGSSPVNRVSGEGHSEARVPSLCRRRYDQLPTGEPPVWRPLLQHLRLRLWQQ